MIIRLLILGILLVVIPTAAGTLLGKGKEQTESYVFCWISGQMLLWAGFLVICVPMILRKQPFSYVCGLFHGYQGVLLLMAVLMAVRRKTRSVGENKENFQGRTKRIGRAAKIWWIVFWILLCLQWVLTILLAYEEGDDAFYFATATITEQSNTMYLLLPYTGFATGLDARHGLAPFPVWIAYLAKLSGIPALVVAQILLPLSLMGMAYGIYYLIAQKLCAEKEETVPMFMVLTEVLFLFGGYSLFTAENFLLVRAAQGKAVIACIIIPFLLYLIIQILDKVKVQGKCGLSFWFLMATTTTAACLCSTLGTILSSMMLGIAGLCIAVSYRKGKILIPMAICCSISVCMALLYFVVQ